MQSLLEQAEGLQLQVASVLLRRIKDKENCQTQFSASPADFQLNLSSSKTTASSSNQRKSNSVGGNDRVESSDSMEFRYKLSDEQQYHQRLESGPDPQSSFQIKGQLGNRTAPNSALNQLDWLIRGLPEAYDDEDTDMTGRPLDDLAVEKLIREGGLPPSQLVFPSLHAVGQQIMKRLQGAKCLVVTFNHVFVYSARYGVRRHCSRLLVRPPEGCRSSGNEPESIVLELPELLGRIAHKEEETVEVRGKSTAFSRGQGPSPSAEKSRFLRPKKRASVGVGPDAFFVGGADLQRTVQFPIEGLSDRVLQGWLQGGQGGSLRIELESHVTPPYKGVSVQPNAKGDKSKSEYQVFGYMNIPLGGLLGTEGLDAIVTCEFEADKNTMATVLGRQQLLPLSSRSTNQVALGPKLGKITCRLTVISDSNTATVNTTHGQKDCQIENAFGTAYPSKRGSVEERSDRVYERGEVKDTPVWSKQNAVAAPSLLLPVPPIPPTASIPFPTPVSASVSVGTMDAVLSSRMPPVPTHPIRVDKGVDMGVHTGGGPYELGGDGMRIRGQAGPVPQDDPLHSAMSYVPSEAPRKLNTQQGPVGGGQRAVMGVVLKSLFGLDVGALQPKGPRLEGSAEGVVVCRAVVAYKLSTSEREEVRGPWIRTEDPTQSNGSSPDESTTLSMATSMCSEDERGTSQGQGREDCEEEDDLEYSIGRSRVHDVSLTAWKPPVFEVWAEWGVAGSTGAGRTRGQSDSVVVLSKRLLGLSRFPPNSVLDQMMGLAVTPLGVCPGVLGAKSSGRGFNGEEERREIALVAAVHLSQSRVQAERAMQHCLSPYSDWVEAPTTATAAASAAAVGAVSADQSKDPGPLRSIEIPAALKKAFIELERKRESAEDGDRGAGQERKLSREKEQTADMERERFTDMSEEKERIGQKAKEEIKEQKKLNDFRMTERGKERGSDTMIGNKSRDERGWTEVSIGNSDGAEDRIQDLSADSDLDRRPRNFLPKPLPLAPPLHPSLPSASSFPSTLSISRPITSDTYRITPCSDPSVVPPSKTGSGSHPLDRTAPPVVHILDITVEGAAEFLSDAGEELGLYGSLMGCFVLYTFPNLGGEGWGGEGQGKGGQKDTGAEKVANAVMKGREVLDSLKGSKGIVGEGNIERERRVNVEGDGGEGQEQRQVELSQLWWDVECPVLNGRVRHVFESRDEGQWDSEDEGDGEGEGEGGILFHVICSDSEGLLPPKGTRETLASARLSHSMLKRALSHSATQTFSLPLQFHTHTQYQDINTGLSSHSSRTTLTPGFRGPILMNVAVSHHLQPVHLQSIDICSDPLAIISRAKTVRNTTSVRDTAGPIKIPRLPTPDQSDLAGDDLLSLTAYERLQRGLYSWGLRGPESARKQSTAAVVALSPHNLEMKGNSNSKGKGESKGERESGQGIEDSQEAMDDEETGVALRGEGTRDREKEREREGERGVLVHVTVGKITNWPPSSPLAPSDPVSVPSHNPVPPTSTPATGGGSSSLFCVVDCSHITSDEGVTLGLSKYGHARTGSFTTSLQPVVPRTASSDGGERARRDIVWEETADMYVRGAHVHPTQTSNQQSWSPGGKGSSAVVTEGGTSDREVERVGGDLGSERGVEPVDGDCSGRSALSCCRGASLIVTVYLRRQWLLSDCLSDPDTSSTSQQGSVNVLHIGDQVVGRAVVDLSILALGLTVVCGWYHLIDAAHTHTGQIFLSVSLPPVNVPTHTGRILGAISSTLGNVRDEQPYISALGVGDVAGVRNIEGESMGIENVWVEERWKEEDQSDEEGKEEWYEDEEEEDREREDEEEERKEYEVDLGLGGDLEYDMQRREMKRKSVIESIAEEEEEEEEEVEEEEVEEEEEEEFMHSRDHGNGVDADEDVDDEMEKRVNEKEEVEKGENEGAEEEHIHIVEKDGRESVGEDTGRVGESVGESVGGHRKGEGEGDREGEWRQHGREDREILGAKRDAEEVDRSEVQCSERAHRHIQEGGGGAEGEGFGGGDGAVRGEQVQEQQEEQEYDLLGLSLASFPSTPERTLPGESVSCGAHPLSAGDQYKLDPFPDLCYMGSPVAPAAAAAAVIVDIAVSKERAGKGQTDATADSDSDRANSSGSGNGSVNSSGSGDDSGSWRRSCGVDDSGVSLGVGRDGGYDSGVGLDGTSGDSRGEDWSLEEEEAGVIDGAETEAETVEYRDRSDGESGGEKEGIKEGDRDGRDKERERRESGMAGVRSMTQYWDSKCAGDKKVQDDDDEEEEEEEEEEEGGRYNQSDSSHSSGDIHSKSLPCDTERDIDTSSGCEGEVKTRTRREDVEDEDVSVDKDIDIDNAGDSSSVCDDSAHREKESEEYSGEEYSEDTDFLSKNDSPPRSTAPGSYPHSPVSTAAPSPPYSPIEPTHTNTHTITHTNTHPITHTNANDRADELTRSSGLDDVTVLSDSANRHSTPRPHPDPYPRPRPHPDSDLSISRDSPSHQYDTSSYAASCSTQSPHSSDGMYSLHSDVIVEGGEDEVRGTGRGYEQGRGAVEEESSSSDKYSADFDLEETEIETEKEDEEGEGEGEGEGDYSAEVSKEATSDHSDLHSHSKPDKHSPLQRHGPVPLAPSPPPQWDQGGGQGQGHVLGPIEGGRTAAADSDRIKRLVGEEVDRIVKERYGTWTQNSTPRVGCSPAGKEYTAFGIDSPESLFHVPYRSPIAYTVGAVGGVGERQGRNAVSVGDSGRDPRPYVRDPLTGNARSNRTAPRPPPSSGPSPVPGPGSRPISDVIARALSAAKRAQDNDASAADRSREKTRFPGRQRQFIDLETERVSKIMLRTMGRSDHT